MKIGNFAVFGANGADASVNQTSAAFVIPYVLGFAFQAYITGSAAGTVALQASCDPGLTDQQAAPTNWTTIANSSLSISSAANVLENYGQAESNFNWIRVVYTASSGTGTIQGRINTKGGT